MERQFNHFFAVDFRWGIPTMLSFLAEKITWPKLLLKRSENYKSNPFLRFWDFFSVAGVFVMFRKSLTIFAN